MSLIAASQSDALLKEIEQQTKNEIRALLEVAEREAGTIVTQARTNARRRMHEAVEELRREGARRLSHAKAQVETEQRMRDQQRAAEAINRAWPLLIDALAARWRDPAGRHAWTTSAARHARDRLRHRTWAIHHPVGWSTDEQQRFREALGTGNSIEIAFTTDNEMTAGIRVCAEQATLDATPPGLLADRPTITAVLLTEIQHRKA